MNELVAEKRNITDQQRFAIKLLVMQREQQIKHQTKFMNHHI